MDKKESIMFLQKLKVEVLWCNRNKARLDILL